MPLIFTEIKPVKQLKISRISLLIGSILPDIIDKPIAFLGLGSGRSLSHSLIFVLASFLILFVFTKRNKPLSFSFLIGVIFHLLLDIPSVPLFYPFIDYDFPIIEELFRYYIVKILTDPLVIITELTGVMFLVFIVIRNKLYHLKDITGYLKGNHHKLNKISD